jgi:ribosome-associated protein
MSNIDTKNAALVAYKALDEKMGIDIKVIDIKNVSIIADYFIIASASNSSQIQALCDNVEEELSKIGMTVTHKEGNQTGWVLMDFNDIIVHVFTEEDRNFYNLERIWRDGKLIDVEELNS